jgi:hypothetical protein
MLVKSAPYERSELTDSLCVCLFIPIAAATPIVSALATEVDVAIDVDKSLKDASFSVPINAIQVGVVDVDVAVGAVVEAWDRHFDAFERLFTEKGGGGVLNFERFAALFAGAMWPEAVRMAERDRIVSDAGGGLNVVGAAFVSCSDGRGGGGRDRAERIRGSSDGTWGARWRQGRDNFQTW